MRKQSGISGKYTPPQEFRSIIEATVERLLRAANTSLDKEDGWEFLKRKNGCSLVSHPHRGLAFADFSPSFFSFFFLVFFCFCACCLDVLTAPQMWICTERNPRKRQKVGRKAEEQRERKKSVLWKKERLGA